MKFFDYSEAERKEWREADITRAFLSELDSRATQYERAAVLDAMNGAASSAQREAAHAYGLRDSVYVAETETK